MTVQISAPNRRIVVGVDGSPGSRAALAWAMTRATSTEFEIHAAAAWPESVLPLGPGHPVGEAGYRDGHTVAAIVQKIIDDTVAPQ